VELLLVFQMFAGNNQEIHHESLEIIHEVSRVSLCGEYLLLFLNSLKYIFAIFEGLFSICIVTTSNKVVQLSLANVNHAIMKSWIYSMRNMSYCIHSCNVPMLANCYSKSHASTFCSVIMLLSMCV
jgi:hypothetical protein